MGIVDDAVEDGVGEAEAHGRGGARHRCGVPGRARRKGGDPLKLDITLTFLELGDATSRNLEFSHCDDVWVSYGEETITETNLLEIRRRHPGVVHVRTFPKRDEGQNGADWEWHIVGRRRTLKMRVQAKRLQRNGVLKVRHKVKSSGKQQRDLLIAGARTARMKAVYCIYFPILRVRATGFQPVCFS